MGDLAGWVCMWKDKKMRGWVTFCESGRQDRERVDGSHILASTVEKMTEKSK